MLNLTISDAKDRVDRHRRETWLDKRSDIHRIWRIEKQEKPEIVQAALNRRAQGLPGALRYCRDPDTGEVYGYVIYNTF